MIEGTWTIDLRPDPDSDPYLKVFRIEKISEDSFSGVFYDTKFNDGILNLNWDFIYFAFTTKDANSFYYHSGYFQNDTVYGISFSPERAFTAPWKGIKISESQKN
jgi:hypothetical protein